MRRLGASRTYRISTWKGPRVEASWMRGFSLLLGRRRWVYGRRLSPRAGHKSIGPESVMWNARRARKMLWGLTPGTRTWQPRSGFANENTLAWKADTHIGACFQRKKHESGFWSTHGPLFICSNVRPRCAWAWEGGDGDEGGGRKGEGRASKANHHVIVRRAKM